jgi:hypothetical protein
MGASGLQSVQGRGRPSSLNVHDWRLYECCRSRPSCRPRMYRRWQGCGTTWARQEKFRAGFVFGSTPAASSSPRIRGSDGTRQIRRLRYHRTAVIEPQERRRRLTLDAAGACLRGTMLILKYFLVVGAILTAGLIALNAHLLPAGSTAPAMAHSATSASLPTVAPKAQPADTDLAVEAAVTPPKEASPPRRSHRSARAPRRSQ